MLVGGATMGVFIVFGWGTIGRGTGVFPINSMRYSIKYSGRLTTHSISVTIIEVCNVKCKGFDEILPYV